jgi:protein-S-isoprenylcysteine O-methyltransferase Ste14
VTAQHVKIPATTAPAGRHRPRRGILRIIRTVVLYLLLVCALQFGVIAAVDQDYAIAAGVLAVAGALTLRWKFRRPRGTHSR